MKKLIASLLILALLPACSLAEGIERVAAASQIAQIALFALAPDRMVGIATEWDDTAREYIDEKYLSLPVLGQLHGGKGEVNLEELLRLDPQLVLDIGETKPTLESEMEALTEQTGLPFIHVPMTLDSMGETYRELGRLLNMPEEAERLAEYCESVYGRVKDIADSADKARLLYVTGAKGINVIARDSYHSQVIDMLSDNLAVVELPSSKGTGNEVDMERILMWDPDYIIFSPDSVYDAAGSDEIWRSVKAIRDGNYFEAPFGPHNWMGFPPSAHRLLGMLWMAKLLYPEAADYDLYDEAARYFELFYHARLTRAQFDALMANSLGKR